MMALRNWTAFSAPCLALILSATEIQAQRPLRDEKLQTIDWFVNKYYYPKAICAYAEPAERARHDETLASIRKENLRAFEIAEKTKQYADTVAEIQPLIDRRFRDGSKQAEATAECTSLTDQMVFAQKRNRHDALFEALIKMFGQN
jgi:hypothetical protein